MNFGFSLKGKLAELHKSITWDINSVNQRIYDFLNESINSLGLLNLEPKIYSQPSLYGSYRLNFDIELKQDYQYNLLPVNKQNIVSFLNSYLMYIANDLQKEDDGFLDSNLEGSARFSEVKNKLQGLYDEMSISPASSLDEALSVFINDSASKLAMVTDFLQDSDSFRTLEIGSYSNSSFHAFGYLHEDYKSLVRYKLLPDDINEFEGDIIEVDENQKSYRILVFSINRESGKGRARLYYQDENYDKIIFNVNVGDKDLSNSIYTKSLDENKVIDVIGIATKKNGKYRKLESKV